MRRRRIALAMALALTFTSVPTGALPVYAAEDVQEELIIEDESGAGEIQEQESAAESQEAEDGGLVIEEIGLVDSEEPADAAWEDSEASGETESVSSEQDEGAAWEDGGSGTEQAEDAGSGEEDLAETDTQETELSAGELAVESVSEGEYLADESDASEEPVVTGLSLGWPETVDIFDFLEHRLSNALTVTYDNEVTETLSDCIGYGTYLTWTGGSYGHTFTLTAFQDGEQVTVPVGTNKVGSYELHISGGELEVTQSFTVTEPENIESLTLGNSVSYFANEETSSYYSFTPDETGKYVFTAETEQGTKPYVSIYRKDGDAYIMAGGYWMASPGAVALEAEKTYYYVIYSPYSNLDCSGQAVLKETQQIDSIQFDEKTVYFPGEQPSLTVKYADNTEEIITNWTDIYSIFDDDESGSTKLVYRTNTANGDTITLKLFDTENKLADITTLYGSYIAAERLGYTYTAATDDGLLSVSKTVDLAGVPADAQVLAEDGSLPYHVSGDSWNWFILNPTETQYYTLVLTGAAAGYPYMKVFQVSGDGMYLTGSSYGWQTMQAYLMAGNTYAVLVYDLEAEYSGDLSFYGRQKVTELSFDREALEADMSDAYSILETATVNISYNNGMKDYRFYWYPGTDEDGDRYYWCWAYNQQIALRLLDASGEKVDMGRLYYTDQYLAGEFTLEVYVMDDEEIKDSIPVKLLLPDPMEELSLGGQASYGVEETWVKLDSGLEPGDYRIGFYGNGSEPCLTAELYEMDGQYMEKIDSIETYDIQADALAFKAEAGKSYFLRITGAYDIGTLSLTEKEEAVSVSLSLGEAVYEATALETGLKAAKLNLTYGNAQETVSQWTVNEDWEEDDDGYDITFRTLQGTTSQGDRIVLSLEDESGVPVTIPGSMEQQLPIGKLKLTVSMNGTKLEDAAQAITVTLPEAEVMETGATYRGTASASSRLAYAFTPEEEGTYTFTEKTAASDESDLSARYSWNFAAYQYESGTLRMVSFETMSSSLEVSCEAKATYYLVVEPLGGKSKKTGYFTVEKKNPVTSVALAAEKIPDELIAGLDTLSKDAVKAVVTYEDETQKTVRAGQQLSSDSLLYCRLYPVNEQGEVDFETPLDPYGALTEGSYYLAVEADLETDSIRDGKTIRVISMAEAAAKHPVEEGSVALESQGGYYICAGYTAASDGAYVLTPDALIKDIRIFDETGKELDKAWTDTYSPRVELEADGTYYIAMRASKDQSYTLKIVGERKISQAELTLSSDTLIGGLDSISKVGLLVNLVFENGEVLTMEEDQDYADGYGFYYEVVDLATGKTVDASMPLAAGTYQVTGIQMPAVYRTGGAVYRTGSAVYRTGSAVYGSEEGIYRTGSAIFRTESAIKTNSVTIQVSSGNTDEMETLTEEVSVKLKANGARQLFAFTPLKDAYYTLDYESWLDWQIYACGSQGLEAVDGMLTAGETYVICISKVPEAQTVTVTSKITELAAEETVTETVNGGTIKKFLFTAPASGGYKVTASPADGTEDSAFGLEANESAYAEGGGTETLKMYLEAGETCFVSLTNYADTADYAVTASAFSVGEVTELIVTPKSTEGYYAEDFDQYSWDHFLDVTLKYSDGSEQKINPEEGTHTSVYTLSETEDSVRMMVVVEFGTLRKSVTLEFAKLSGNLTELTANVETEGTLAPSGRAYYSFIPEETGDYYVCVEGPEDYLTSVLIRYENASRSWSRYAQPATDDVYSLKKGKQYIVQVDAQMEGWEDGDYRITVIPRKQVQKLELLTEAESCYPALQYPGAGMTALATYADGTTAVIDREMSVDAYGNPVSCSYSALSDEKTRVFLTCGGKRVSCDIVNTTVDQLPSLETGKLEELSVKFTEGYGEILAAFTPKESGTYQMMQNLPEGVSSSSVFYSVSNRKMDTLPAALTAGETYVFRMRLYQDPSAGDTAAVSLQPYEVNDAGCLGGHSYPDEWTILREATCTVTGLRAKSCTVCLDTISEEIPALEHQYGEILTTPATATENGEEYQICSVCGEKETVKILVATQEQEKIDAAKEALEDNNSAGALAKIQEADNQALLDSDSFDLVEQLEEKLIEESKEDDKATIGDTAIEHSEVQDAKVTAVTGAAVTVAAAIQEKDTDASETYAAKVVVSGEKKEEIEGTLQSYTVDIHVNIVDSSNTVVQEKADLQAPIRITIEIPASFLESASFGLYHYADGAENEPKKLSFVCDREAGTITFETPSLSPFELRLEECEESGHMADENGWTVKTPAACLQAGEETAVCRYCNKTMRRAIAPLAHSWSEWEETKAPTCTAEGERSRTCEHCQSVETEVIQKTDHVPGSTYTVDQQATCTEAGSQSIHCTVCGAQIEGTASAIPAAGHSWDGGTVKSQPTCTENGVRVYTCIVCGAVREEAIAASGGHSFGEYTVTASPTVLSEGSETRTCSVCGQAETRALAKLQGTISLTVSKLPLQVKKSVNLQQIVTGLAEGDSIVSWQSSNKKVATVNGSGKVTGKKVGKTTVTVTLASGASASLTVTVQKAAVKTTKISGVTKKVTLKKGGKLTLKPVITPISSLEKTTYTTSNKKVAVVTKKGVVTAKGAGKAKITVKSGKKKVTVTVTVTK